MEYLVAMYPGVKGARQLTAGIPGQRRATQSISGPRIARTEYIYYYYCTTTQYSLLVVGT